MEVDWNTNTWIDALREERKLYVLQIKSPWRQICIFWFWYIFWYLMEWLKLFIKMLNICCFQLFLFKYEDLLLFFDYFVHYCKLNVCWVIYYWSDIKNNVKMSLFFDNIKIIFIAFFGFIWKSILTSRLPLIVYRLLTINR